MAENKLIMIDGVDVSNCENYNPKGRFTCNPHICNCHQKPNCYFKQLARKTQECEELKKERDFYSAEYTRVSTQLMSQDAYILIDGKEVWSGGNRKLKQQLDQLKIAKEQAEQKVDTIRKYCNYMTTFNNANKTNKGLDVEEVIRIIDEVENEYNG